MKRGYLLLIVFSVIITGVLIYFYGNQKKIKRYDWIENYASEKKEPYGTSIIKELLEDYNSDKKVITLKNNLKFELSKISNLPHPVNYVLIGNSMMTDSAGRSALLRFVANGNTAFISSRWNENFLLDSLYKGECGEWNGYYTYSRREVSMNFYDDTLYDNKGYHFKHCYKNDTASYDWQCIDGNYFCDSSTSFISLAYVDSNYTNYVMVKYGKGKFLFHTSPMVFSNIQLLEKNHLAYYEKIFSYLNSGDIYWDEYNKSYHSHQQSGFSETPLKYILSQPALKWAWYVLLALVVLYILFQAKRKQKAIPILPAVANTSLEYIKIIGRLYHQQNNPKQICIHKMKLLLAFIRNKYYISTNNMNADTIRKIADKSELPLKTIEQLFNKYKLIETLPHVDNQLLAEFHQLTEYFYKHCK